MTPEDKLKAKIVRKMREMEAWVYTVPRSRFGRAGIPDILAVFQDRFIAIEVKRPDGKGSYTITPTQASNLAQIGRQGGHAFLVDSEAKLQALIEQMKDWEAGLCI